MGIKLFDLFQISERVAAGNKVCLKVVLIAPLIVHLFVLLTVRILFEPPLFSSSLSTFSETTKFVLPSLFSWQKTALETLLM